MDNLIQSTPFLSVRSIKDAVTFYRDRLGFIAYVQMDGYAYVERGKAGIRLLIYTPDDGAFAPGTAYIDVRDVDTIVAEHRPSWSDLPDKAVLGPIDQAYNQRELFIRDPDGNLLIFGQGIGPNADQWAGR